MFDFSCVLRVRHRFPTGSPFQPWNLWMRGEYSKDEVEIVVICSWGEKFGKEDRATNYLYQPNTSIQSPEETGIAARWSRRWGSGRWSRHTTPHQDIVPPLIPPPEVVKHPGIQKSLMLGTGLVWGSIVERYMIKAGFFGNNSNNIFKRSIICRIAQLRSTMSTCIDLWSLLLACLHMRVERVRKPSISVF